MYSNSWAGLNLDIDFHGKWNNIYQVLFQNKLGNLSSHANEHYLLWRQKARLLEKNGAEKTTPVDVTPCLPPNDIEWVA
uniref:SKICH domain-containing protein n=1 Tax=Heterorhabditis bacteriophora TaxID=37862 RepID=A0A1I7XDF4_HETBA